jgi:RNA polymerase sigma factor (sigma-70 family)
MAPLIDHMQRWFSQPSTPPHLGKQGNYFGAPFLKKPRLSPVLFSRWPISLALPIGKDSDDAELGDFIEDREAAGPAEIAGRNFLRDEIDEILNQLPPRQAHILRLRYGLQDGQARSLRDVGYVFGLSGERIRQLEKDALSQLRQPNFAGWASASLPRMTAYSRTVRDNRENWRAFRIG